MRNVTSELEQFLQGLARAANAGDRLPPIRDLMRRFGVSQVTVQRVLQSLRSRGLIESQVGRGTYFVAPGEAPGLAGMATAQAVRPAGARSVLLLRRSMSIARGRVLLEGLQQRFADAGHRVLEVSYNDPEHARAVLRGLPQFDACVVQSTFKPITIELLAALRERASVLAVDGAALAGADVDAVGMEWGEPLARAVQQLQVQGHRHILYATTSHPFLASQLGLRRCTYLQASLPADTLATLEVPGFPHEDYEAALVGLLQARMAERAAAGAPAVTALVAWGIEDGAKFLRLLADIGLDVPGRLSVVLLGRTDLANEHADFFDTVGCSVADQVEGLHRAITARWADPARPYGVDLIPVTAQERRSVAPPA